MAATQVRFMYYLTLAVAVVNAAFVAEITRLFDLDLENSLDSIRQVETYQVIVVLLVVLLLLHRSCHRSRRRLRGIRANRPVRAGARRTGKNRTTGSKRTRLRRGTTAARTTPTNSTTTERTIRVTATTSIRRGLRRHVVVGLRPPDNDPGRTDSALEPVPAKRAVVVNVPDRRVRGTAELVLDAIAAGEPVADRSTEELRQATSGSDSGEDVRYVMIDNEMAGQKFSPITQWSGPDYGHYVSGEQFSAGGNQTQQLPSANENYDNTTLSSLYLQDAAGMEHYRLVHENDKYAIVGGMGINGQAIPRYPCGSGAPDGRTRRRRSNSSSHRPAAIIRSIVSGGLWDGHVVSSVKTYERVEGATITGSVDDADDIDAANATPRPSWRSISRPTPDARSRTDSRRRSRTTGYEVTVPYATNDELGVEDGYTDSSVEATGNYSVSVFESSEQGLRQFTGETAVPSLQWWRATPSTPATSRRSRIRPGTRRRATRRRVTKRPTGNETDDGSTDADGTNSSDDGTADNGTANAFEPVAPQRAH